MSERYFHWFGSFHSSGLSADIFRVHDGPAILLLNAQESSATEVWSIVRVKIRIGFVERRASARVRANGKSGTEMY